MKKTLLSLLFLVAFCSCQDNDGDYAEYMDFVTVETDATAAGYHFRMDDGRSLYPGDRTRIGAYDAVQGQRALLYFNLLDERVEGFDYNAAIYAIRDIYTGAVRMVSDEELAELPDAPTSLLEYRLRNDYLTLRIAYPVVDNSKHNFLLVRCESTVPVSPDYLDVELRHDASTDQPGENDSFYISFPVTALREQMQGKKGLMLRVQTQANGIKRIPIDAR